MLSKERHVMGEGKLKSHMNVLLCANIDGRDKQPALVIGHLKKPRCLKGVQTLPLPYRASKKASMTGDLFQEWLDELDDCMRRSKILLLIAKYVTNTAAAAKGIWLLNVHL